MSQSFEASWWEILLESFAAFKYDEVNFLIQINSSFIFVSGMKNYESPENSRKEFICKNVYLKKNNWLMHWIGNWSEQMNHCKHETGGLKVTHTSTPLKR